MTSVPYSPVRCPSVIISFQHGVAGGKLAEVSIHKLDVSFTEAVERPLYAHETSSSPHAPRHISLEFVYRDDAMADLQAIADVVQRAMATLRGQA